MTPLAPAERPALEAFLRDHLAGSMFPLSNLAGRGRAMQVWCRQENARITGMLGLTEDGMLLPQWPATDPAEGWLQAGATVQALLQGRDLAGIVGPAPQAEALRHALGLQAAPCKLNAIEPGFTLDLARLIMPPNEGCALVLPGAEQTALLIDWRAAYAQEVLGEPAATARQSAEETVAQWLRAGSHRLLQRAGQFVALTGFNADLGDAVQVGGVYCPPELRRQGLARRAVALHLAEARAHGARRAVLFAASTTAARAYRALGFQPAGEIALVLFATAQKVQPCP